VLAIDLGTGGPKVALVEAGGRVVTWASEPVATLVLPGGGAEQDAEAMWTAVVVAARRVLGRCATAPPVVAVAVTSQYMSAVPVRGDGTPTGPCVLWMDTRGSASNLALLTDASVPLFLERHGLIPLPSGNDNVAHTAVLRDLHPEAYARAAAIVEPMDYLCARLTGDVRATQSSAFSSLCCDNRTWGATTYDSELVAATRLDPRLLAPLAPLRGDHRALAAGPAAELGLPAGRPVVAGTIDSITSAVGTGAVGPSHGGIVIGTTSVVVTHVREHRAELTSGLLSIPSPLPQHWFVMAENGLGGRALEWFLREVVHPGDELALGPPPEDLVERALRAAARVAPGCAGLQFLPWLLGSIAPAPDDEVRGAFVGLGLHHGRAEMCRAVLEGVALNAAWLLPAVERFTGSSVEGAVRFGGGGAQSELWAGILADALGRPVERVADPRATNARGAAMLAFDELGVVPLDEAVASLPIAGRHEPDPAARPAMEAALARLVAAHPALRALPPTP